MIIVDSKTKLYFLIALSPRLSGSSSALLKIEGTEPHFTNIRQGGHIPTV